MGYVLLKRGRDSVNGCIRFKTRNQITKGFVSWHGILISQRGGFEFRQSRPTLHVVHPWLTLVARRESRVGMGCFGGGLCIGSRRLSAQVKRQRLYPLLVCML